MGTIPRFAISGFAADLSSFGLGPSDFASGAANMSFRTAQVIFANRTGAP